MARLQVADEAEAVAVTEKSAQIAADVIHGVASAKLDGHNLVAFIDNTSGLSEDSNRLESQVYPGTIFSRKARVAVCGVQVGCNTGSASDSLASVYCIPVNTTAGGVLYSVPPILRVLSRYCYAQG